MTDDIEHLLPDRGPRQRARQQRAIEKIDAVVEAAMAALEREGESGVRIAEICDVTGVSYGTVYHHFGDRAGLIRAAQFKRLVGQPGDLTPKHPVDIAKDLMGPVLGLYGGAVTGIPQDTVE